MCELQVRQKREREARRKAEEAASVAREEAELRAYHERGRLQREKELRAKHEREQQKVQYAASPSTSMPSQAVYQQQQQPPAPMPAWGTPEPGAGMPEPSPTRPAVQIDTPRPAPRRKAKVIDAPWLDNLTQVRGAPPFLSLNLNVLCDQLVGGLCAALISRMRHGMNCSCSRPQV